MQFHEHRHNFKEGLLEKSKLAQHAYEELLEVCVCGFVCVTPYLCQETTW
jgi:hypothetical protein